MGDAINILPFLLDVGCYQVVVGCVGADNGLWMHQFQTHVRERSECDCTSVCEELWSKSICAVSRRSSTPSSKHND